MADETEREGESSTRLAATHMMKHIFITDKSVIFGTHFLLMFFWNFWFLFLFFYLIDFLPLYVHTKLMTHFIYLYQMIVKNICFLINRNLNCIYPLIIIQIIIKFLKKKTLFSVYCIPNTCLTNKHLYPRNSYLFHPP